MKLTLYKVLGFDPDNELSGWEIISSVKVMTESDLRQEFLWAYNNGAIASDIIYDYSHNPDYKEENWDDIGSLSAATMVDIMNDMGNYNAGYWYVINETEIEIKG